MPGHGSPPPRVSFADVVRDGGSRGFTEVRPRNKQQQRLWGCSCGESANFASRTKCRNCGRHAPRSIEDRQREVGRLPLRSPAASPGRQAFGANDKIAKQLEELRKENAALRRKTAEQPAEITVEDADMGQKEDTGRTISQLVEALAYTEKALGTDHEYAAPLRELLAKRAAARCSTAELADQGKEARIGGGRGE